ncbi:MAG: SBBP repeat-containing protein [Candidatus Hodarchaeales archaeon]|jgi:hypothetical protein
MYNNPRNKIIFFSKKRLVKLLLLFCSLIVLISSSTTGGQLINGFIAQVDAEPLAMNESGLTYSTFLGSTGEEHGISVVLDSDNNIIIAGYTFSSDFPTTVGAYDTSHNGGGSDVFISKLSPDGTELLFSTFLGGSGLDSDNTIGLTNIDLAIDSTNNIIVAGYTQSTDLPTTPDAWDSSYNGNEDYFIAKISPNGSDLLFLTYLGGTSNEYMIGSVLLDNSDNIYITGLSHSSDYPTTSDALNTSLIGDADSIVTKLSANGSVLLYSSFIGANHGSWIDDAILDQGTNELYLVGTAHGPDFPLVNPFDSTFSGDKDAFVMKLSSNLSQILYSTFIGGNGIEYCTDIAVDTEGNIVIAGMTGSTDFPVTTNAWDTTYEGENNGVGGFETGECFITKFSANGSTLIFSSFWGGSGLDYGITFELDASNNLYITGETDSTDFPTNEYRYDWSFGGGTDKFVTKLSADGSTLLYWSYLGGVQNDCGVDYQSGLALISPNNLLIVDSTKSNDFPTTTNAYDSTHNSNWDVYVVIMDLNYTTPPTTTTTTTIATTTTTTITTTTEATEGYVLWLLIPSIVVLMIHRKKVKK